MALHVRAVSAYGGLYQQYCSTENTGSEYPQVYNIYNTVGSCFGQCERGGYAFAVVQDKDCWCANYGPANHENTANCNQKCPGYPGDLCGNSAAGLYGYIPLDGAPFGHDGPPSSGPAPTPSSTQDQASTVSETSQQTSSQEATSQQQVSSQPQASAQPQATSASAATSQSSATSQPAATSQTVAAPLPSSSSHASSISYVSRTEIVTQVVTQKETETQSQTTVISYTTSVSTTTSSRTHKSVPTSSSIDTPSSSAPTAASRPTTVATQVRVTTISGSKVTQTVSSTPLALAPSDASDSANFHREGLSGGAIAGIVIGTLLGLGALLLAAFLLWRRKRSDDAADEGVAATGGRPRRTTSLLSRTGLIAGARPQSQNMAETNHEDPFVDPATRTNSMRYSMMFGAGMAEGVSPVSPLGSDEDLNQGTASNRHSRPMVYDQRLNPSALFANHDNGSRTSMQDQQDYSRPLGIANPEFRPSFDSR